MNNNSGYLPQVQAEYCNYSTQSQASTPYYGRMSYDQQSSAASEYNETHCPMQHSPTWYSSGDVTPADQCLSVDTYTRGRPLEAMQTPSSRSRSAGSTSRYVIFFVFFLCGVFGRGRADNVIITQAHTHTHTHTHTPQRRGRDLCPPPSQQLPSPCPQRVNKKSNYLNSSFGRERNRGCVAPSDCVPGALLVHLLFFPFCPPPKKNKYISIYIQFYTYVS